MFLSASTIPNKTFPRLASLAASAVTVLMGPTLPWLPELHEFGIDYLAGIEVSDAERLFATAIEGGGVRIFETGVRYKVVDLTLETQLSWVKAHIAEVYAEKGALTAAMEAWYEGGNIKRFPQYAQLNDLSARLSRLDSVYKARWDAQQMLKTQARHS